MKLSKNFSHGEFTRKKWENLPKTKQYLLRRLCAYVLQPIRDTLGSVRITSGVRTQNDYNRLKKAGYHPSATSDHNYGNLAIITPSNRKYKIFGANYNYSVGAADIQIVNFSTWAAFEIICQMNKKGDIDAGQIIYEKSKNGSEWIHISNSPKAVYDTLFCNQMKLNKTMYLTTVDGGKTYRVYKP